MAYGHMSDRKALAREIAARTKPRFIETTTVSPNGLGGYNAYTPPSIGPNGSFNPGGTTSITPNGLRGYNVYSPPRVGY
jgi:hypothetical protein